MRRLHEYEYDAIHAMFVVDMTVRLVNYPTLLADYASRRWGFRLHRRLLPAFIEGQEV